MITYITENDKNGKARYYKVIDGKKKVISRAEYEAHENEQAVGQETVDTNLEVINAQLTLEEMRDEATVFDVDPTNNEEETVSAADPRTVGDVLLTIVKGIIESTGNKNVEKTRVQNTKTQRRLLVNYRNFMIFSIAFGENSEVTSIRFMGTTSETRKKANTFEFSSSADIGKYKDEIIKQVEFIDQWYLNGSKKSVKSA